ncbi:MAG: hypothetical protein AAGN82_05650 [Myxococcota bacterium]
MAAADESTTPKMPPRVAKLVDSEAKLKTGREPVAKRPAPTPPAARPSAAPRPEVRERPGVAFEPYGFIKAGVVYARGGFESYGRPNASAPTAAAHPMLVADPDGSSTSFQVQQSRLGLRVRPAPELTGTLEFDFISFDRSSPTVQAQPRLRIATVAWQPNERHTVVVGQTWDLFSPLNSVNHNYIGNLFQAGNAGFMRVQAQWHGHFGPAELGLAVGMPGANATPAEGAVERGSLPTAAARFAWTLDPSLRLGASSIATERTYGEGERRRVTLGGNLFVELTTATWTLRGEVNAGRNLANIGALTLGQGHEEADVDEVGGWLGLIKQFDDHRLSGAVGMARVVDPASIRPGVVVDDQGAVQRDLRRGPGIERNLVLRAGYAYAFFPGASVFVDPVWMSTVHRGADEESLGARSVWGVDAGAVYAF